MGSYRLRCLNGRTYETVYDFSFINSLLYEQSNQMGQDNKNKSNEVR